MEASFEIICFPEWILGQNVNPGDVSISLTKTMD